MFTFYMMTEKGFRVLESLLKAGYKEHIDAVISARDKNTLEDHFEEIEKLCLDNGIPFYDRRSAPVPSSPYSIAISWRWLIDIKELIVLHDSLLPRYRGFAPLVTALVNGDTETGVTALYADKEYDKGNIILQKKILLHYPVRIADAIECISVVYADIVNNLVKCILAGEKMEGLRQDENLATYSLWLDDEDYQVDWNKTANELLRFIHATGTPYKGASTMVNGMKARIIDAEIVPDVAIENKQVGKVIFMNDGLPVVVCGTGLLKITRMVWDDGENALPLKNFRTRFK